ncbi:hypothetical protein KBX21_03555 [Nocardiopsis sp. B62]|nr:hypothetical protein [Nocardiopsis sp. B62]
MTRRGGANADTKKGPHGSHRAGPAVREWGRLPALLLSVTRVLLPIAGLLAVSGLLPVTRVLLGVVTGVLLVLLTVALAVTRVRVRLLGARVVVLVGLLLTGRVLRRLLLGLRRLGLAGALGVGVGTEDEQTRGGGLTGLAGGDQLQPPPGLLDALEDAGQPRPQLAGRLVVGVDLELDDEHPPLLLRGDLGVLDDSAVPHDLRDAHE